MQSELHLAASAYERIAVICRTRQSDQHMHGFAPVAIPCQHTDHEMGYKALAVDVEH